MEVEFASGADVSFLEKMTMFEQRTRKYGYLSDDANIRANYFSGKLRCLFDDWGNGKTYEWEHAVVTYYQESACAYTNEPTTTRVIFCPFELRINNLYISRYSQKTERGVWYFDEPEPEEPKQEIDTDIDLSEIYYTDKKGNRIKENDFEPDTIIYVIVKGKNLAGKTGDLELSNTKVDFEYEGKHLENDILENYTLKSDYNRIELKVIKPKNDLL